MSNPFNSTAVSRYTRRTAIADSVLIDATQGEFADVSREHFPNHHLAMTSAVFTLLERALESGARQDLTGLWHDVLWMSRVCPVRLLPGGHTFENGIRAEHTLRWHELKILFHGGDHGEPCATVMLPDED